LKTDSLLRKSVKVNFGINRIYCDRETLLKYADSLNLFRFFDMKKKIERFLPNVHTEANLINSLFINCRRAKAAGSRDGICELILDNYYLVDELIKLERLEVENIAKLKFPILKNNALSGYPRVFALASEYIFHRQGAFEENLFLEYIEAFQVNEPLYMREVYALPTMIRSSLIYYLSSIASAQMYRFKMRNEARRVYKLFNRGDDYKDFLTEIYKQSFRETLEDGSFLEEFYGLVGEKGEKRIGYKEFLRCLKRKDIDLKAEIEQAQKDKAKNQIVLSNIIKSIRTITNMVWDTFFEKSCYVNRYLSKDNIYRDMDFESKEYYRRRIEKMAMELDVPEISIAKKAIELYENQKKHIGYFLFEEEKHDLIAEFSDKKYSLSEEKNKRLIYFILCILVPTVCLSIVTGIVVYKNGYGFMAVFISFIASLVPLSTLFSSIVNRIFLRCFDTGFIPRLCYDSVKNCEEKTMVITPTLLLDKKGLDEQLQIMEVNYLANKLDNICFALVADFKESKQKLNKTERELIEYGKIAAEKLNRKYNNKIFYFYTRRRIKSKEKYIAYERKRGAILDLCRMLAEKKTDKFYIERSEIPKKVDYVITIDSDTQMLRETTIKLIGAMLHPLNKPIIRKNDRRVIRGYGIIAPIVGVDIEQAAKTKLAFSFSGSPGLDSYSACSSNVYQDVFGESIFAGKGIFDLKTYITVLEGAFENERVLSHDFLEGHYLRCGLASDVIFMDGYPQNYISWSERQHRWTRGDWQNMPWLFSKIKNREKDSYSNPLDGLAKFQILDNLRRSLLPVFASVVILLGLTLFVKLPFILFMIGFLPYFFEPTLALLLNLINLIRNRKKGATLVDAFLETKDAFFESFYRFSFLLYEAYRMSDAIIRTLYRMLISKNNLLEWRTADESEKISKSTAQYFFKKMWISPVLAAAIIVLFFAVNGMFELWVLVMVIIWAAAPYIAFSISKEIVLKKPDVGSYEYKELNLLARKTFKYFDDFCKPNHYYWAPDNYQEYPKKRPVYRTSPTNVGFSLAAFYSGYVFGYIPFFEMIDRLNIIVDGIEKAEKWEGHLFNWYDLERFCALPPRYVSSVDSGNLACYLVLMIEALENSLNEPLYKNSLEGIYFSLVEYFDTIDDEVLTTLRDKARGSKITIFDLLNQLYGLNKILEKHVNDYQKSDIKRTVEMYIKEINEYFGYVDMLQGYYMKEEYSIKSLEAIKNGIGYISLNKLLVEQSRQIKGLSKLKEMTSLDYDADRLIMLIKNSNEKLMIKRNEILKLKRRMEILVENMDFSVLYNAKKELFVIGYDYEHKRMSESYYDLLASEARQTAFIAIAKGDVPTNLWFKLSRPVGVNQEKRVLLSWSGTMFEYLMPLLIMKNFRSTLLDETYDAALDVQIAYGKRRNAPWGISECGYYAFDFDMYYQYKAFGVPKLGLRFSDTNNLVISPYSTCLGLMVNSEESIKNYKRIKSMKAVAKYGLYEAIDFAHGKKGRQRYSIVKSYMAHHQGMILSALTNYFYENKLQKVFHSSGIVMATQMLLKERSVPRNILIEDYNAYSEQKKDYTENKVTQNVRYKVLGETSPKAHILSNGKLTCMISQLGSGFLRYNDWVINQWSTDYLRENCGNFIYINNKTDGERWSAAYLPSEKKPKTYVANFTDYRASFVRKDSLITTKMDICISPEVDIEVRNICIFNESNIAKSLDVVSVIKPMLSSIQDYISHPAFSNLFLERVETNEKNLLIIKKRSRDEKRELYVGLKCIVNETARTTRQTSYSNMFERLDCGKNINFGFYEDISNSTKMSLAIKAEIQVLPRSEEQISFISSASESLEDIVQNLNSINEPTQVKAAFELAKTSFMVQQEYDKTTAQEREMFNRVLSSVVFSIGQKKDESTAIKRVKRERLFRYGLNEKNPYVLTTIKTASDLKRIRLLIKAFNNFREKAFPISLVILGEQEEAYYSPLEEKIREYINMYAKEGNYHVKTKAVYIRKEITERDDVDGLKAGASLIIDASKSIIDQLAEPKTETKAAKFKKIYLDTSENPLDSKYVKTFNNGFGGYINEGKEYLITLNDGERLPSPWVNVLANKDFGTVVSTEGGGYTWANNARLFRITPFRNHGYDDVPSEGIYIRNDISGQVKNIMPCKNEKGSYNIIHGKGYTIFKSNDIVGTSACVFVPKELKAKIFTIDLDNNSDEDMNVSIYYYLEPVLGEDNFWQKNMISSLLNDKAITAQNVIDLGEMDGKAYITCLNERFEYTGDKKEVFGSFGAGSNPSMLKNEALSSNLGKNAQTCLAIRVSKSLKAREHISLVFAAGFEKNDDEILNTIEELEQKGRIKNELKVITDEYNELSDALKVKTPEKSFDYMLNDWLIYQTKNSRLLGRTGYYQSGGAFGFRDQLQDVLAFIYINPSIVKKQILRCAESQFIEGDVLHWWHEKARGVRTQISDDLLFLPYVLCEYITATGDVEILNMQVPYLESEKIPEGKEDLYSDFERSEEIESIYMHALRAISHAHKVGRNGLALIKGGDWNDGMNRVGKNGKGESVWLTQFLFVVMTKFSEIASYVGDNQIKSKLRLFIKELSEAIEDNGWDGSWYKRGFYDNGDPLGSLESDECKIDLISQSWAVISGACDEKRCEDAFFSAYNMLVDEEAGIIKLLDPPFKHSKNDPGYIKSYVTGVRENGGQYTHGAAWYIIAAAILKKRNIAYKLFDMINPINLTSTKQGALKYKGEPYVVAGDVYSGAEKGKAGWTWYTGSAAWLYRAGIEYILGFKKSGNRLYMNPCIPDEWDKYEIEYKFKNTAYKIVVENKFGWKGVKKRIILDGKRIKEKFIPLSDDGKKHIACIELIN